MQNDDRDLANHARRMIEATYLGKLCDEEFRRECARLQIRTSVAMVAPLESLIWYQARRTALLSRSMH